MSDTLQMWVCPLCETQIEDGRVLCPGCHAEIVYGLTRTEWKNMATAGAATTGVFGVFLAFILPNYLSTHHRMNIPPAWGIDIIFLIVPIMLMAAVGGYSLAFLADRRRRKQPPRFYRPAYSR